MRYFFEDYALDTDRRELRRGADVVPTTPQVFDLLDYLIRNRERVVSKDDLVSAIWKGRIVSDAALTTRLNAARSVIGDSGDEQRLIKTLPRKGIRFVGAVHETNRPSGASTVPDSGAEPDHGRQPASDRPSIAVLPFHNLSGDPEQEYFADGMVEEIITALSRSGWLFVIARNFSFAYKGKSPDIRTVGRELGVRYVLEGSVRRAGARVRVTCQLIETATGGHVWADRFEGELTDIFTLQDNITESVVGTLKPNLQRAEIARATAKPTESLDAYDLYLRALAQFHKNTEDGLGGAVTFAKRALVNDQTYAPAAALIAYCRVVQRMHYWGAVSDAEVADAVLLARQGIETGQDDPEALWMGGYAIAILGGDRSAGIGAIDRAIALNPNSALAWCARGWNFGFQNQPVAAIEAQQRAIRLSPFDPLLYYFSAGIAFAHMEAGRFEDAIEWADRALQVQPRYIPAMRIKLVSLAHLGRSDDARNCLKRVLPFNQG